MKHLYILSIVVLVALASCSTKNRGPKVIIEAEPVFVATNSSDATAQHIADIYSLRLEEFGLNKKHFSVTVEKNIVIVQVDSVDFSEHVMALLSTKGVVSFSETYFCSEIVTYFYEADSILRGMNKEQIAEISGREGFSYKDAIILDIESDFCLHSPVIAYAAPDDTAAISACLRHVNIKFPSDLRMLWTMKREKYSDNELYALVAVKYFKDTPNISGGIVSSNVKASDWGGFEIFLSMDEETSFQWKKMTGYNIGRSIAILFDDKVVMYPNVHSEIENGQIAISADFDETTAKMYAAIFSSKPLPLSVIITVRQ